MQTEAPPVAGAADVKSESGAQTKIDLKKGIAAGKMQEFSTTSGGSKAGIVSTEYRIDT